MIKLIASDMDGTLLNSKHTISKGNIEAIKIAQKNGLHFTIVTGRSYDMVKPLLDEFNIQCECILMNGAEYRNNRGEIIESIDIESENVEMALDILDKAKLHAEIFTRYGIYTFKNVDKETLYHRVRSFSPFRTDDDIEEFLIEREDMTNMKYLDSIKDFLDLNIPVSKIITYHTDAKFIAEVKEELRKITGIAVSGTFSNDIEINNIYAQKGIILAKAIKKLGIERNEVIVLGDSFNDYSMFTEFENSYAMENAIPEIKEIAKYITASNDEDGVGKAILECLKKLK